MESDVGEMSRPIDSTYPFPGAIIKKMEPSVPLRTGVIERGALMRRLYVSRFTNNTKAVAVLLAAALLFVVLASMLLMAREAGHDCTGDGCVICSCLQQCSHARHLLGNGTEPAVFVLVLWAMVLVLLAGSCSATMALNPVSSKVRQNN